VLQDLLNPLVGLARLQSPHGDLSGYPLDGLVPLDAPGPSEVRSIAERLRGRIKRANMTIRQRSKSVAGGGGFHLTGSGSRVGHSRSTDGLSRSRHVGRTRNRHLARRGDAPLERSE
jgi:hypothetical protein